MNKNNIILSIRCIMLLPLLFTLGCTSNTNSNQLQSEQNAEQVMTYNNASDLINTPDKIIFYHQGNQTIIDKTNSKFNNIIELCKKRVSNIKSATRSAILPSDIETTKKNNDALEFIYIKNVAVNWKINDSDFTYKFDYNSIFIPLTGEWNKFMIFSPNFPGPLGGLEPADELQKYLDS